MTPHKSSSRMKPITYLLAVIFASVSGIACAQSLPDNAPRPRAEIDATARFIFYSVLEGLYEDGLANEDVDQILMKKRAAELLLSLHLFLSDLHRDHLGARSLSRPPRASLQS